MDDRKSTTSFVFNIRDTSFKLSSKKYSIVTLLISEVEFLANTLYVYHFISLRRFY